MGFNFPSPSQRISIQGRTGSGKSLAGAWLLSESDLDTRPHIIVDYKYDKLLDSIEHVPELSLDDKIPKQPGLYKVHPQPGDEDGIEKFMWNAWARENLHLHIDEAYMIPLRSKAYNSLLTQGRSKNISMANLTQRPSQISRFVFTESDYFYIFKLIDKQDRKRVAEFTGLDLEKALPRYHAYFYDVAEDETFLMKPVPDSDTIKERFYEKLKPKPRRWL